MSLWGFSTSFQKTGLRALFTSPSGPEQRPGAWVSSAELLSTGLSSAVLSSIVLSSIVLSSLVIGSPAWAQPYPVQIVEAEAVGYHLEVRLAWLDADVLTQSNLVVYGESGQKIASVSSEVASPLNASVAKPVSQKNLEPVPDVVTEEFSAMTVMFEDILLTPPETHLYLQVEDAEEDPLSQRFPFVVNLQPELGGGCGPAVESRLQTNAVLVDSELSATLDSLVYHDLEDALAALKLEQPDLECAIASMQAELDRLSSQVELNAPKADPDPCTYFWQAVLDGNLGSSEFYDGPYNPIEGRHIITPGFTEVGGYTDRSSHCIKTRAFGTGSGSFLYERPHTVNNQLDIRFSTRRWTGSPDTCGSCNGAVNYDLAYSAHAVAQVIAVPEGEEPDQAPDQSTKDLESGTAHASTSETAVFTTGTGDVFALTVDANASSRPPLGDLDIALLTKGASAPPQQQPAKASLAVTGTTLVSSNARFVAQTEYQLDYIWWVNANASCSAMPQVYLELSSIPLRLQPFTAAATRIKLQRYP